jgi:aryl-alcohol dehydrogenase-like predicted oxidoreductase
LGRGFLTGAFASRDDLIPTDRRHAHPRFQEGNFEENLRLLAPLDDIARARAIPKGQVVLAWLLAQWDGLVPIPGTKRRRWLEENIAALDVTLTAPEIARLSAAFAPGVASGLRYPEFQLKKMGL